MNKVIVRDYLGDGYWCDVQPKSTNGAVCNQVKQCLTRTLMCIDMRIDKSNPSNQRILNRASLIHVAGTESARQGHLTAAKGALKALDALERSIPAR